LSCCSSYTCETATPTTAAANGDMVVMRPDDDGRLHAVDISGQWRVTTVHEAVSHALGEQIGPESELAHLRRLCDGAGVPYLSHWDAGAVVLPAGCGPCNDAVVGPIDGGEVSISTATNNPVGRFGARDAHLYLGSPATVAASAVAGRIVDPRAVAPAAV
jgi:homoaconitase/3-isopropylmalate dehydratase large subunit